MKSSSIRSLGVVIGGAAAFTAIATLALGGTAFAQSTTAAPAAGTTSGHQGWMPGSNGGARRAPGVFGTVASVGGDSITVTSKGFGGPKSSSSGATPTPTTYTVDATNATVTKDNAASSVSAIAVGDTVMVQGTVTGTNVTATKINDGMVPMAGMQMGHGMASSTRMGMGMHPMGVAGGASITGNGEPVVGGGVTAISGTTLTVSNKSNVTYSVDASGATVIKGNATSSVAAIAVGDNVVVQGTVNGTAVVASSVMDQGTTPAAGSSPAHGGFMGGVIGGITGFFQHLFGFF